MPDRTPIKDAHGHIIGYTGDVKSVTPMKGGYSVERNIVHPRDVEVLMPREDVSEEELEHIKRVLAESPQGRIEAYGPSVLAQTLPMVIRITELENQIEQLRDTNQTLREAVSSMFGYTTVCPMCREYGRTGKHGDGCELEKVLEADRNE